MILRNELKEVKTAAISGHVRPDGDCVGACMALYHYIRKNFPDIEVDLYLEEVPKSYSLIEGIEKIKHSASEPKEYDVFFILDCGDKDRLGFSSVYFETAKRTVCIDHHISNGGDFTDSSQVEPKSAATCEVLFYLMKLEEMNLSIATALYMGLIHDTGVFKHSNTTERTLMAAAKLVGMGVEFTKIINTSFYEKSYVQNQILGRALLESVVFYHGSCIFSALKLKDLDFYGVGPSDLGGIVDQLIVTEGIRCAIFLYEIGKKKFKVSMRSKEGIDVSQVAMHFGGGGHIRAAGCEMMGSVYDVINNLSARIALQIGEEPDSAEVMAEEEPCTAE